MPDVVIGALGAAALVLAILAGLNVMLALILVGFGGMALLIGLDPALSVLSSVAYTTVSSYHFSVVPMFLLMGFFAMRAGLGEGLFEAATRWLGRMPGGLAIASTGSAAAFGAASGSSVGTAILFTKLSLPPMLARGYDKGLASASIAISGTLAVLIPPSALVVVYAILTNTSIGPLLLAGILPGAIFALLLCLTTLLTVLARPHLAPMVPDRYSWSERFSSLKLVGPLVLTVVLIVSGLYLGIFTPTEAGAIGALVTFLMAIVKHRGLKGVEIPAALRETTQLTAMIFAIIIGGLVFARFLALSGVVDVVGNFFTDGGLSLWFVVGLVTLLYLGLGMLLDPPALLAVTLPITHPVMLQLGFDPIWFGIYVLVLAEIACVTPPVGLNCFVVKGAAGDAIELNDVFRGLLPYILASLVMLGLLLAFPQIVTVVPELMAR